MRVWVVTRLDSVRGVFSSREKATEYLDAFRSSRLACLSHEVDAAADGPPEPGLHPFAVVLSDRRADAQALDGPPCSDKVDVYEGDPSTMWTQCWARDPGHAVQIAVTRRAEFLARKAAKP